MPQSQANTPQSFIGHLRCQEATAALLHLQGLEEDEEFLRVPTLYRHTEASQKLGPGVHDPTPPPRCHSDRAFAGAEVSSSQGHSRLQHSKASGWPFSLASCVS